MAWMRMMGARSVDYHRKTVLERADDHPGLALEYYASRGETPLRWGGSGAAALGLSGPVDPRSYEATYGPGGARSAASGTRLVHTTRPGMELVISAHKSVAELGVIGLAEDMHQIMDAERDATLAYLDQVTRDMGGRRGRAAVAAPTGGLTYAHARHATSRAGDPCPHDHLLLANVVEMRDPKGGWKAPDTTLWREHLHAATMVGRLAAAKGAVDLGYAIAPDPGPSGRLGHWRILGIPDEVLEVHSKRAAQIEAECRRRGQDSYRARNMAARVTRSPKRHEPEGALVARWRDELARAGHPVEELREAQDRARAQRAPVDPLTRSEARELVAEALGSDGRLARRKVFGRKEVIVEVAPALYGQDPALLDPLVTRTLADPEAIPLLGVRGAREPVWSTAHVLSAEVSIAASMAEALEREDAPALAPGQALSALGRVEEDLGRALTPAQREAALAICTSGRGAELVVGVAGSGKTTTLGVVRAAFEEAGFSVWGTATSGQAARNLGKEAGIDTSKTLAALCWALDHHRLTLSASHVVVLDEVGMTDDADLVRLLAHVQAAGAKIVLLGDDRQLSSVGPGGALGALLARHPGAVHPLMDNLRQRDRGERQALAALRSGEVEEAVSWYVQKGRIRVAEDRDQALGAAVEGWARDVGEGRDTLLLAWRRANVEELNRRARELMEDCGALSGPELVAPGGRAYRAGDQVVALSPSARGRLVTSQRGTVDSVDPDHDAMVLRLEDGSLLTLAGEEASAEHLGHGYATTVHRAQGATSDRAHVYADGGGRELSYVAMSRAREETHAYLVADDLDQGADDLRRDWARERRPTWAIDTGLPALPELTRESMALLSKEDRARLQALAGVQARSARKAMLAAVPPDRSSELTEARRAVAEVEAARAALGSGTGVYTHTPAGRAATDLLRARAGQRFASHRADYAPSWRERRAARKEARELTEVEAETTRVWESHAAPEAAHLEAELGRRLEKVRALEAAQGRRERYRAAHPGLNRRLAQWRSVLAATAAATGAYRDALEGIEPRPTVEQQIVARARWARAHARPPDYPSPQPDRHLGRGPRLGL